ncbi:MAG TPA: acyl-CoA dehydrogenase family protein [Thermoanaerobaculia bacterium]|jgi:putative acyl-CoA dehydrogenase|nr:acyl-CoA dehydrogenase family protein [Thermoanaerobaculia bacterium]
MSHEAASSDPHATHTVFNQPPPLADYNVAASDPTLMEALRREGAGWAEERVTALGALAGRAETIAWGFQANENRPVLHSHDRTGVRIDAVEFHPAWHSLLALGVAHGLHALPWREPRSGAHVARAALFMTLAQVEAGVGCPLSMTYSAVPALRLEPAVAAAWEPRLTSLSYDPRLVPAETKTGSLCGMAMTEKQGGSDVRANTTVARPVVGSPGTYELTGHKWFCSAPMCDVFLVLAQAPGGLSCFLLPRFLPDGERNRFHIQRLKDKLGNRSNASSEIELRAARGFLLGAEGRGVPTILEMVMHTRLDCVIGAAASLRQGTVQAIHHARHRHAFGRLLFAQPLMRNVLADLAVESAAATLGMMRLAHAFDAAVAGDAAAVLFKRLATAVLKYWTCKRAPVHAAEALECLGGNGYVEEWPLARLYREAPLNSLWEGSGNVQCLDVLRALRKAPESLDALTAEIGEARGGDTRLDAFAATLRDDFARLQEADVEGQARRFVERLALALQGSLLVRHAPPAVADAFCASRLGSDGGRAFGTLPVGVDAGGILNAIS